MKLLIAYLRQYRAVALFFALCALVFAAVFALYRVKVEAVAYAAGLCALPGAIAVTVHFRRFRARHLEKRRVLEDVDDRLDELPEPSTPSETDDRALILALDRRLRDSQTALRAERQELTDYLTAWAHQIKTPIAVMRMSLKEQDTEEHRALSAELFRVEQYVEMALSYARLGDGASDLAFRECALDPILRQAVRKYAPLFIRKRIRLDYAPTDIRVLTDEKWLGFIVEQLLSNAVKYTEAGAVSIRVLPGKELRIADTGIGIAPEDLPRIFEKGFTGYNGRTGRKSTGLGLYLSRLAADRLSIGLRVESRPGAGTTFILDLSSADLEVE